MKKLLAMLGAVGLSTTGAVSVIACSTNDRQTVDITKIEKNLLFLLQTKEDKNEPWTEAELSAAIVDKKIDKEGGISVEVGEPTSPGAITQFEQVIVFKGNATNKNSFTYSGEVVITYAYGENLPPDKVLISSEDVEASLQNLQMFLNGTIFTNQDLVYKSFRDGANIPGAPVEGLRFGDVSDVKIETSPSLDANSQDPTRALLRFTFEANVDLKDENVYKFEESFDKTEMHKFEGKVYEPIIIDQTKIEQITETIQTEANKSVFFNQKSFNDQIKKKVEDFTTKEGILYDTHSVKAVSADNKNDQTQWLINIELILKPNRALSYELPNNAESLKINISTNFTSLMNMNNSTMVWNLFDKGNEMIVAPQFIQFGGDNDELMKIQGEHLIDQKLTAKWGKETDLVEQAPNDDIWEEQEKQQSAYQEKTSLAIKVLGTEEGDTEKFVKNYLAKTTSFNYDQNDTNIFANDKALFIRETDENWQDTLKSKLNQEGSLDDLQANTTMINQQTLPVTEYFHVVFLTPSANDNYKTSSKAFRVRLNPVKI